MSFIIPGLIEFCKRVTVPNGETGKPFDGYVRIRAGMTTDRARVQGRRITTPQDAAELEGELHSAVFAMRRDHKVFMIEWVLNSAPTSVEDNVPTFRSPDYQADELVVPKMEMEEGGKSPLAGALAIVSIHHLSAMDKKDHVISSLSAEIRDLDARCMRQEYEIMLLNQGAGIMKWREAKSMLGMGLEEAGKHIPQVLVILSEYVETMKMEAASKARKAGVEPGKGGTPPTADSAEATLDACIDAAIEILKANPDLYTMQRGMKLWPVIQEFQKRNSSQSEDK